MRKTVESLRRALAILLVATTTAAAQSARLVGTVADSVHRGPLRDATVVATPESGTLDSVFHMTHTDAKGQFALGALRPGRYTISVEHAFTDSIGLDVPPRVVAITGDGTARTALALPSVATLRRTLCPAALADTTLGVMLGVVRLSDGSPAAGGRVVLGWSDLSADKTLTVKRDERTASTTTDSLGVYRACGVPAGVTLLVQAQLGARQSGVITEQIGEAGVLVRDFTLGAEGVASTSGSVATDSVAQGSAGPGVLTGSVIGMRGERIAGARVSLAGTTPRSTTVDARGDFRLTGLPTGTQGFEVTALGYLPRRFRADVSRDTRAGMIRMDRMGVLIDSVRVIARRQYDARYYPEFEARLRRRGFGQFVTEEMIEQKHPFMLSDMLRMMPGFAMHVTPNGTPIIQSTRGISSLGQPINSRIESEQGGRPGEERLVRGGVSAVGGTCIKVYFNGVLDPSLELNRLVPDAVHGVEVYSQAQAPAKYQNGPCGVVLVWSK